MRHVSIVCASAFVFVVGAKDATVGIEYVIIRDTDFSLTHCSVDPTDRNVVPVLLSCCHAVLLPC